MNLKNKEVIIIGAGKSGFAAAKLCAERGASVFITESSTGTRVQKTLEKLSGGNVTWETGGHTEKAFRKRDLAVISPGIDPVNDTVQKIMNSAGETISEVELACRFLQGKLIAVTGTNGKTTTTSLITHILNTADMNTVSAGNIGEPLSGFVNHTGYVVTEVSSFQLEKINRFHPQITVLLNLTPDHLDRYASSEEYYSAKLRILENLIAGDVLIWNSDCAESARRISAAEAEKLSFSVTGPADAYYQKGKILLKKEPADIEIIDANGLPIPGMHNVYNVLSAILVCDRLSISPRVIRNGIASFKAVPHRLEKVAEFKQRKFYNDSKSTNQESLKWALKAFNRKVILIAGGKDKNEDLRPIKPLLREKVKKLILIGQAAGRFAQQWGDTDINIITTESMKQAVRTAFECSRENDVILLSPACSSFDMFDNFEHRGEVFKNEINGILDNKNKER